MRIFAFSALGLLLLAFAFVWAMTQIRYHITFRHVKITLFGLSLRRIPIADVSSVSKRRGPGLAERWWSTLRPKHRVLVIRRHRGLCRNVIITPRNRYTFKSELERAMDRLKSSREEVPQKVPIFSD